jgi:hypothetical protein
LGTGKIIIHSRRAAHPDANASGRCGRRSWPHLLDLDGFIERVQPHFEANGFYEKEIARHTEQFGQIAHVWSTYESRHHPDDPQPFGRGINSIQLFNDGRRWWIVSIYWQQETAAHPIPQKYLPTVCQNEG